MGIFDFWKKKRSKDINPEETLKALIDFVRNSPEDFKKLSSLIHEIELLRKNRQTSHDLKREIKKFDALIKQFRFFEDDVDLAGERIKALARLLKKEAAENNLEQEWQDYLKKDDNWNFNW